MGMDYALVLSVKVREKEKIKEDKQENEWGKAKMLIHESYK